MLTFQVKSKTPDTKTVDGVEKEGFLVRVVLAPDSGNRSTVYLFASAVFIDATDPLAALNVNDTFPLSL